MLSSYTSNPLFSLSLTPWIKICLSYTYLHTYYTYPNVYTLSEVEKERHDKLQQQITKEGQRLCVICQVRTYALMSVLVLDQSSFTEFHRLDMHQLLESWLSGLKIPRREDYLAGGRWASRSYYNAIYNVAESILAEAKPYKA